MALYEQQWFIDLVKWARKWNWFDKYIWGKSKNIEDFTRNPAEVFFEEYCSLKEDVKGTTILSWRFGFKQYKEELIEDYKQDIREHMDIEILPDSVINTYVELPSRRLPRIKIPFTNWILFDATWLDKFNTKYTNSVLSFHIGYCRKGFIVLPFICFVIKFWPTKYFQTGVGWAPEHYVDGTKNTFKLGSVFCKLRFGNYDKELEWNPGLEVYGYWEGKC